jgi:hypothetical protein
VRRLEIHVRGQVLRHAADHDLHVEDLVVARGAVENVVAEIEAAEYRDAPAHRGVRLGLERCCEVLC